MRNEHGFTLIELIIVISVIGILSAFALPRFASATNNANQANMDAIEGVLRFAIVAWASDELVTNGTYTYPASTTVTIANMIEDRGINDWSDNGAGVWTYVFGNVGTLTYAQTGGGTGYTITKLY